MHVCTGTTVHTIMAIEGLRNKSNLKHHWWSPKVRAVVMSQFHSCHGTTILYCAPRIIRSHGKKITGDQYPESKLLENTW